MGSSTEVIAPATAPTASSIAVKNGCSAVISDPNPDTTPEITMFAPDWITLSGRLRL